MSFSKLLFIRCIIDIVIVLLLIFLHDLEISFNSRYLIDVASQLDGEKIELFLNDTGSPALIKDPSDFDSIYVVMPMKG